MRFIGYQEDDGECITLTFASESSCQKMMAQGSLGVGARIIFETDQEDFETASKLWDEFRDVQNNSGK